jgi:hypothetical protein
MMKVHYKEGYGRLQADFSEKQRKSGRREPLAVID